MNKLYRSILDDDETVARNIEESLPITIELIKEFMNKYRFYFRYERYSLTSVFAFTDISMSYEIQFDSVMGIMENGQINYDHKPTYYVRMISNVIEPGVSLKKQPKNVIIRNMGDIKRYAAFCRDVADVFDKFLVDPEYVEQLLNVRIVPLLFTTNDIEKFVYIHNFIYSKYYLKNERVPKFIR